MITPRSSFCCALAMIFFCGWSAAPSPAGTATPATLTFTMDFPGNTPPHYTMQVAADGSGTYTAAEADGPYRVGFQLSKNTVAPWFAQAQALHFFAGSFQSPRKVAFTGTKTLAYAGLDGNGTTTFVYSEDPAMVRLTGELQQVALTLQVGQTLESHLRHQRMTLDQDLDDYQQALKDHMASHPEAIASALQELADSPEAMSRVSRKARTILSATQR
jgi:hypothetical protein